MAASVRGFMTPANSEGIIGALLGMAEQPDAGEWLGKIRVPTLVIAGSDDTLIPPSESEALARAIPHVRQRVIPHAGHLVAVDQADAFNQAIQDWLAWGCEGPKPSRYRAHPIQKSIQPCPL
jgi:3-oxoadipate enol-lactonase